MRMSAMVASALEFHYHGCERACVLQEVMVHKRPSILTRVTSAPSLFDGMCVVHLEVYWASEFRRRFGRNTLKLPRTRATHWSVPSAGCHSCHRLSLDDEGRSRLATDDLAPLFSSRLCDGFPFTYSFAQPGPRSRPHVVHIRVILVDSCLDFVHREHLPCRQDFHTSRKIIAHRQLCIIAKRWPFIVSAHRSDPVMAATVEQLLHGLANMAGMSGPVLPAQQAQQTHHTTPSSSWGGKVKHVVRNPLKTKSMIRFR